MSANMNETGSARIWIGSYDLQGVPLWDWDIPQLSAWLQSGWNKETYDIVVVALQGVVNEPSERKPLGF